MTGDQIFGCIAIAAMLVLVVPRLARNTPPKRLMRLALLWIAIFVATTAVVLFMKPAG